MRRIALAAVGGLLAAGCSGAHKDGLADCVTGWWVGSGMTCAVACLAATTPAACAYSDCKQASAMRLGGTEYARGIVVTSVQGRTVEWVGGVVTGSFSVGDGAVQLGSSSLSASCSGNSLALDGAAFSRACPALARALDASASASWSPQTTDGCP